MMIDFCYTCRTSHRRGYHLPIYSVVRVENLGDVHSNVSAIRARNARSAVERWAEEEDRKTVDYSIVNGDAVKVVVTAPNGLSSQWVVTGESVPSHYYAHPIE